MHGVIPDVGRALIQAGKGYNPRDTESGQLLIDRARHLDVLEYLLWINRWGGRSNKPDLQRSGVPALDQQVGLRGCGCPGQLAEFGSEAKVARIHAAWAALMTEESRKHHLWMISWITRPINRGLHPSETVDVLPPSSVFPCHHFTASF